LSEHWFVVAQSKILVEHLRGHSSLALDSVGPLVVELDSYFPAGNFFATLADLAHSERYTMKN
jgi:hypothetical protein